MSDQIKAIALAATIANQIIANREHNPPAMVAAASNVLQSLTEHGNWLAASAGLHAIYRAANLDGQFTLADRVQDAQGLLSAFLQPALA